MILSSITAQALNHAGNDVAIKTSTEQITYQQLLTHVAAMAAWLEAHNVQILLLQADNVPEWLYIDLACQQANVIFVPVPLFFSQQQVAHVISQVKPDVFIFQEGNQSVNQGDFHSATDFIEDDFVFDGFRGQTKESELESELRLQYRYRWRPELQPALEIYSGEEYFGVGPALMGIFRIEGQRQLKYEFGFISELSHAQKDHSLRVALEYEF